MEFHEENIYKEEKREGKRKKMMAVDRVYNPHEKRKRKIYYRLFEEEKKKKKRCSR